MLILYYIIKKCKENSFPNSRFDLFDLLLTWFQWKYWRETPCLCVCRFSCTDDCFPVNILFFTRPWALFRVVLGGNQQCIFHCLGPISVLRSLTLEFSKYEAWSLKWITIMAFWSFHYRHINSLFSVFTYRLDKTSSQLLQHHLTLRADRTFGLRLLWFHENKREICSFISYHRRLNRYTLISVYVECFFLL